MNISENYIETKRMIGKWHSKRVIIDKMSGNNFSYHGEMCISFASIPNFEKVQSRSKPYISLDLREEGFLISKDKEYRFSQKYYLRLFTKRFDVLFKNKLPFFSMNRFVKLQKIDHQCNLDHYLGQIITINKFSFLIKLNVSGPRKKYYLKAVYKRQ